MSDFKPWLYDLGITDYIDYDLLWIAFTHKSYKGMGYNGEDNERLEFLGDAVLDLINADLKFKSLTRFLTAFTFDVYASLSSLFI